MAEKDRHTIKAFSLRIDDELREMLEESASDQKISLNAEITNRLLNSFANKYEILVASKNENDFQRFIYYLGKLKGTNYISWSISKELFEHLNVNFDYCVSFDSTEYLDEELLEGIAAISKVTLVNSDIG